MNKFFVVGQGGGSCYSS